MSISFSERVSVLSKLFLKPKVLQALLSQYHSGYLKEQGWFNSFLSGLPVDKSNHPIPWLSYPCVDFLKDRLNKKLSVFEFGSGSSTIFYSSRVNKIISVEHNKSWYEKIKKDLPENTQLLFYEFHPDGEYCKSIKSQNEMFDIIIVDGMDRVNAIINSFEALTENGVLILDDSERIEYKTGVEKIIKRGYKRIDFWGISAAELYKKCTTIFYREKNCLGI